MIPCYFHKHINGPSHCESSGCIINCAVLINSHLRLLPRDVNDGYANRIFKES